MENMIERVLYTEEEIKAKVKELGAKLSEDYADKEVMMLCILKGAFVFAADLLRAVDIYDISMHFMVASSYGKSTMSSGHVILKYDIEESVVGKHIIIAEDIVDTGRTLAYIKSYLLEKGAASVEICTLFDKPSRRVTPVDVKYIGFTIPDEFIVGYGLDYDERFRNMPYLGILKREVYEK